jgi:OmcA/MtrC family decaheme c-type cytochrome
VTDDEAVPRRMVVKTENCNACHKELALHGGIRRNTEYCVMCHNALHTDEEMRPAEEMPPQTVHFKVMVHRIHTGEELVDTKPHIIYGFGGSIHDFSEVRFPGDRRNCEKCHEPGSNLLPLPSGVLPTTITQEGEPVATTLPIVAACTACHDTAEAKAHAALQTTADGEETCAVCHGQGKDFDVATVHR